VLLFCLRQVASVTALMVAVSLVQGCSTLKMDNPFVIDSDRLGPSEGDPTFGAQAMAANATQLTLDEQPFQVSPDMLRFVDFYAPRSLPPNMRLQSLIRAVHQSGSLSLRYNPSATYTAQQTFEKQEANCLSFAIMFVALADAAGLQAYVNEVNVPMVTAMADSTTLVNYRHVNVKAFIDKSMFKVIDINADLYDMNYRQRRISTTTAQAQFYNNKGVESMLAKQPLKAYLYFKKAVDMKPDLSDSWVNLGVLYSKNQLPQLAWNAYEKARKLDGENTMALINMAGLYASLGDRTAAQELQAFANVNRAANPYFHYARGNVAMASEDLDQARLSFRRALKLKEEEPDFYFALARVYLEQGNPREAQRLVESANELLARNDEIYQPSSQKVRIIDAASILRDSSPGISIVAPGGRPSGSRN